MFRFLSKQLVIRFGRTRTRSRAALSTRNLSSDADLYEMLENENKYPTEIFVIDSNWRAAHAAKLAASKTNGINRSSTQSPNALVQLLSTVLTEPQIERYMAARSRFLLNQPFESPSGDEEEEEEEEWDFHEILDERIEKPYGFNEDEKDRDYKKYRYAPISDSPSFKSSPTDIFIIDSNWRAQAAIVAASKKNDMNSSTERPNSVIQLLRTVLTEPQLERYMAVRSGSRILQTQLNESPLILQTQFFESPFRQQKDLHTYVIAERDVPYDDDEGDLDVFEIADKEVRYESNEEDEELEIDIRVEPYDYDKYCLEMERCRAKRHIAARRAPIFDTPSFKCYFMTSIYEIEQLPRVSHSLKDYGFDLVSNIICSKRIKLSFRAKADMVLKLYRKHGYTEPQIKSFITKNEFLVSLGFPYTDIRRDSCLRGGWENQIIRSCNFFRSFFHTDKELLFFLKKLLSSLSSPYSTICQYMDIEKEMGPNISTLRKFGVPESSISKLLMMEAQILVKDKEQFEKSAEVAKKLGLKPSSYGFRNVITTLQQGDWEWDRKMELLRSYDLSEDEVLKVFRVKPQFLWCSAYIENEIKRRMDLLVNKLHCKASMIAQHAVFLKANLDRNLIPKCSVLQLLMSNGVLEKDIYVPPLLGLCDEMFVKRFVAKYQEEVPEVVKAYQGLIEFNGFTEPVNVSRRTWTKKKTNCNVEKSAMQQRIISSKQDPGVVQHP